MKNISFSLALSILMLLTGTATFAQSINNDEDAIQSSPLSLMVEVEWKDSELQMRLSYSMPNYEVLAVWGSSSMGLAAMPIISVTEKMYIRYGSPDTKEKLAADAKAAKDKIGIHGVSVIFRKPPSSGDPFGQTTKKKIEDAGFTLTQTGKNKSHFTVTLPDPVTQEVTDKFNALFTIVNPDKNSSNVNPEDDLTVVGAGEDQ